MTVERLQPETFIDLTLSDDEEEGKDRGYGAIAQKPVIVPFRQGNIPTHEGLQNINHIVQPQPPLGAKTNTVPLPILPQATRPSVEGSSARHNTNLPNPTKRRKIETAPATVIQNITRILPPAPSYQRLSNQKASVTPPSLPVRPTQPNEDRRTVVDGPSRLGLSSRKSPEGRVQKPRSTQSQQIAQQVVRSVSAALSQTHQNILPESRASIVFKKASKELLDPSLHHISINGGHITADDNKTLRHRIRSQVNKFVQQDPVRNHVESSIASDVEDPFDRELFLRHASSSPTTSFDQDIESEIGTKTYVKERPNSSPATRRLYLKHEHRQALCHGIAVCSAHVGNQNISLAVHTDFSLAEVKVIYIIALSTKNREVTHVNLDDTLHRLISSLLAGENAQTLGKIQRNLRTAVELKENKDPGIALLRLRDETSIAHYLQDVASGSIIAPPRNLRLEVQTKERSTLRLSRLLLDRESSGPSHARLQSGRSSSRQQFSEMIEDQLSVQSEWTDCCGDIATITWTSPYAFICGATAHSDHHNMQYNKPGNLVVGSTTLDTLRAVSNHRIPRPAIENEQNKENALQSMRNTQDPWLYTSVVCTAYSQSAKLAFSASFDQSVKVWSIPEDGSQMMLHGAWYHDSKVNFVVTSPHHSMVATACDVSEDAVRVFTINKEDVSQSQYYTYCGNRTRDQGQGQTWAYFPATIQWGIAEAVSHLLLVGYSPRSFTDDDAVIPEEKRNTGELCIWNTEDGTKVVINSASMQNVFEVLWHPTLPIFLAATSPSGTFEPLKTKTQIRVYGQTNAGSFNHLTALDCPALDINELTIFPNSHFHSYITASCTDGNTYVYDTGLGDQPIHILKHGDSLDNPLHNMELEIADTGVKFAAWGQTKSRFYTGGSDGKVKVWDITKPPGHAHVRDVLTLSAGVSSGAFSDDHSYLLVGDAGGKVHLLSVDDSKQLSTPQSQSQTIRNTQSKQSQYGGVLSPNVRRPKVVIPHPEPPPPKGHYVAQVQLERTGPEIAAEMVANSFIQVHPNRVVGAVQGWNYAETNLYRYEAHDNFDGTAPLLPEWRYKQIARVNSLQSSRSQTFDVLPRISQRLEDQVLHQENIDLELNFDELSLETHEMLKYDRVELFWDTSYRVYKFDYELFPGKKFPLFREESDERRLRRLHEVAAARHAYIDVDEQQD